MNIVGHDSIILDFLPSGEIIRWNYPYGNWVTDYAVSALSFCSCDSYCV